MQLEYQTGKYFTPGDSGQELCCLYRSGHKRLHIIVIETTGVIELKPLLADARNIRPLLFRGGLYPVDRAVKKFRKAGAHLGITIAATKELDRASV